jgi:hypothetical protein
MKALLATAAFAVIVSAGTPASAQVYGDNWNRNDPALRTFAQAQGPLTVQQRRNLARIQTPDGRFHSPNPAYDVYDNQGRYVGTDPDPFIRNDLARDPPGRGDD